MILNSLNKPYPYTSNIIESVKAISFIGLFVFVFVLIFRSDQLAPDGTWLNRIIFSFYFGIISFLIPMVIIIIINRIISPEKEVNWTVKNEIFVYALNFAAISAGNFLLSVYLTDMIFSFLYFLQSVLLTSAIGTIPVAIYMLNKQRKLLKLHLNEAMYITDNESFKPDNTINLTEIIKIESHEIRTNEVLFIESDKNYINIYLLNNKQLRIRFTIKKIEAELSDYSQFVRCHRAYIVNISFVESVEGNAQGLKLFLQNSNNTVSVSRAFIPQVKRVIRPSMAK